MWVQRDMKLKACCSMSLCAAKIILESKSTMTWADRLASPYNDN